MLHRIWSTCPSFQAKDTAFPHSQNLSQVCYGNFCYRHRKNYALCLAWPSTPVCPVLVLWKISPYEYKSKQRSSKSLSKDNFLRNYESLTLRLAMSQTVQNTQPVGLTGRVSKQLGPWDQHLRPTGALQKETAVRSNKVGCKSAEYRQLHNSHGQQRCNQWNVATTGLNAKSNGPTGLTSCQCPAALTD